MWELVVSRSVPLAEVCFYGEYGVGGKSDTHKGRDSLGVEWHVGIL